MGGFIKDSTTQDIIGQLNKRFEAEALPEMVELQREFKIFSLQHSLRYSFALLGIVPADRAECQRWYKFLDHLKTYPSDLPKVNGHDRVVRAYEDNLKAKKPLPVSIVCHSDENDPRVIVSEGRPVIYSTETYVVISIPTTPARVARQRAADTARKRRAAKSKK